MQSQSKFNAFLERLAGRLTTIVLLGFFSLLCCLPIVTIGASLTAVNEAMGCYIEFEEEKPLKIFFSSFKKHFKLSTIVWLIHLVLIIVLAFDFVYYFEGDSVLDTLSQAGIFTLILFFAFEMQMVFVVISQDLADSVKTVFTKSVDIAYNCLLQSFFLLVISIAIPIVCAFILPSFILVLPGLTTFLAWQIIPNMLKKYKFKKGNAVYNRSQREKEKKN